jgi:hypothetical protein
MSYHIQECIKEIEQYCLDHKIQHRFVGGVSYGGLVNKQTTYEFDLGNRHVKLKNHNELSDFRKDRTVKDIDLIVIEPDQKKVSAFQQYVYDLQKKICTKTGVDIPISVEAAIYPLKGDRNWLTQFVTAIEVDKVGHYGEGNIYYAFEDIKQLISWRSIDGWIVELENGMKYTTRSPIADFYAYAFRNPGGVKLKDVNKLVYLKKMAKEMKRLGREENPPIDYDGELYYATWREYTGKLNSSSSFSIRLKSLVIRFYWNTIGTYLAHGKGIGKMLSKFATKFTGVRQ